MTPHPGWIPWAVVGLLAACLAALGAWVLVGVYTGPERDATTLVDNVTAAWSSGDGAKAASYYSPDAVLTTADGIVYKGPAAIAGLVESVAVTGDFPAQPFTVEPMSDVSVFGNTAVWIGEWSLATDNQPTTEIVVLQLEDGAILRQWNLEIGATPPLSTATR